jgi:FAD synthetase
MYTHVVTFGVFDGIHSGHLSLLEQASILGEQLTVVVTRDLRARAEGKQPRMNERERCSLLDALTVVDSAILGDLPNHDGHIIAHLHPDVIAVGYDQSFDVVTYTKWLCDIGLEDTRVIRLERYGDGRHHTSILRQPLRAQEAMAS